MQLQKPLENAEPSIDLPELIIRLFQVDEGNYPESFIPEV